MRRILVAWLLSFSVACALAADKPRVSLVLLTKQGLPLTASQQWYKTFTDLGVEGLQIRSASPGDEMGIEQTGSDAAPRFKVVGILAADNVLYLPGGKFKTNEVARLRDWLENLGDGGAEAVTETRSAFGLTGKQIVEANDDLKQPLGLSTKGQRADAVLRQLASRLKHEIVIDAAQRKALAQVEVADELSNLTCGTALAALLRPAGLVFEPQRSGRELSFLVRAPAAGRESWPVGWKPRVRPAKALPELYQFLNVEIKDTTVADSLAAIESRLKVPFLFDHNALAIEEIDPAALQAAVPEKRMTYSQVLQKVLQPAGLKYELRVDDAEKPLVWITTIKPHRGAGM